MAILITTSEYVLDRHKTIVDTEYTCYNCLQAGKHMWFFVDREKSETKCDKCQFVKTQYTAHNSPPSLSDGEKSIHNRVKIVLSNQNSENEPFIKLANYFISKSSFELVVNNKVALRCPLIVLTRTDHSEYILLDQKLHTPHLIEKGTSISACIHTFGYVPFIESSKPQMAVQVIFESDHDLNQEKRR